MCASEVLCRRHAAARHPGTTFTLPSRWVAPSPPAFSVLSSQASNQAELDPEKAARKAAKLAEKEAKRAKALAKEAAKAEAAKGGAAPKDDGGKKAGKKAEAEAKRVGTASRCGQQGGAMQWPCKDAACVECSRRLAAVI